MRTLLISLSFLFLIGCSSTNSETPQEGLKAIRELHATSNYATLVRERYAEKGKLRGEDDYAQLISMMERRYGAPEKKAALLSLMDEALKSEPTISINNMPQEYETDTLAIFTTEQGPIKIYLMKSGLWGFHL